ncbi:MAG TPA: isoprenylcysteine carboxylmethyltransferase family protein [Cytophagales bacterium]|nr:isoprenylcysteine carboxylmethyltransferase family protein [Cytophagales bacterium]
MHKLIPPHLFLLCAASMPILDDMCPIYRVTLSYIRYAGISMFAAGLLLAYYVSKVFKKYDTEIHTFGKPTRMITEGFFKYSRNPIYVGFTASLIGLNLFMGSLSTLFPTCLFVVVTQYMYIPYEEKTIEKLFGTEYLNYKRKVRRWL